MVKKRFNFVVEKWKLEKLIKYIQMLSYYSNIIFIDVKHIFYSPNISGE